MLGAVSTRRDPGGLLTTWPLTPSGWQGLIQIQWATQKGTGFWFQVIQIDVNF